MGEPGERLTVELDTPIKHDHVELDTAQVAELGHWYLLKIQEGASKSLQSPLSGQYLYEAN